jgi:hypothetical protein
MKTHKLTNTPLHKAWMRMNKRCNNPNYESYHRYGGRGIRVCERWESFENFYADMKDSYRPELSLERKNNNLDYSPENCKWATKKEQANNRHTNRIVLLKGVPMTLAQLSEKYGIGRTTIAARLDRGLDVEDAIRMTH